MLRLVLRRLDGSTAYGYLAQRRVRRAGAGRVGERREEEPTQRPHLRARFGPFKGNKL